jgi:hypothetical protein
MALILDQTFASDPGGSFATLRQSAGTLVATYQAGSQAYDLSNATLAHNIWDISSVALQSTGECEIDIELLADQGSGTCNASLWMVYNNSPAFSNGFRFHHNLFTWNLESWTGGTIWAGNTALNSITNTLNSAQYNTVGDRRVLNMRWDSTGGFAAGKATIEIRIDGTLVMSHFGAISAMRPGVGIRQSTCRVHSIKVWDAPQVAMIQIANKQNVSTELGRKTRPLAGSPNYANVATELGIVRGTLTGEFSFDSALYDVAKINLNYNGNGTINGTVKVKGTPDYPVSRKVQLFHNNKLLQEVWSDSLGDYSFDNLSKTELYNVVVYDHTSTYRAIISDGVTAI